MTCNHSFRTNNPLKILRAIYNEQCKVNAAPEEESDFLRFKSREVFNIANVDISDTAKYSILTKLAVGGQLSIHSNPEHKQGYRYSITPQGLHCYKCHRYQEGIESAPENFKCGALPMDI